jgi:hypothetical protein
MKDLIKDFLLEHCFKIMILGFTVSAGGIIFYSQVQRKDPFLSKIAFIVTATGIGIYIIGRIGVIIQRRTERKKRMQVAKAADNETKELQ